MKDRFIIVCCSFFLCFLRYTRIVDSCVIFLLKIKLLLRQIRVESLFVMCLPTPNSYIGMDRQRTSWSFLLVEIWCCIGGCLFDESESIFHLLQYMCLYACLLILCPYPDEYNKIFHALMFGSYKESWMFKQACCYSCSFVSICMVICYNQSFKVWGPDFQALIHEKLAYPFWFIMQFSP